MKLDFGMLKRLFAVMITLLLSLPAAHALDQYSCTTIDDINDKMGPVRNQGDMGWCYAHVAADMLTAKFKTSPDYMSATQLAVIYNYAFDNDKNLDAQGGDIANALKVALRVVSPSDSSTELLKFGFCPNSLENESMTIGPQTSLSTKIARLKQLKSNYDAGKYDKSKNDLFWKQFNDYKSQGSILSKMNESHFINMLNRTNPGNFLLHFADMICGEYRHYNQKKDLNVFRHHRKATYTLRFNTGEPSCTIPVEYDLLVDIHRELEKRNVTGVGFHANFIQPGGNPTQKTFMHANTVVGRRWKNGACQLRLRNTWGTACETVNAKGQRQPIYSSYVQECDKGTIWVKENDLAQTLDTVTFITEGPNKHEQQAPKIPSNYRCNQ